MATDAPLDHGEYDDLSLLYRQRVAYVDAFVPGYRQAYARLASRMCGPRQLVVPAMSHDDFTLSADFFAEYGLFAPHHAGVTLAPGRPSQCHANVAGLWAVGEIDYVATGYGLSTDGIWRPHSFGIRSGSIVETTTARSRYFGVVLNETAAWAFVCASDDQVPPTAALPAERVASMRRALAVLESSGTSRADSALVHLVSADPVHTWPEA